MLKAFGASKWHALGATLLLSSLLSSAIKKSKQSESIFSPASPPTSQADSSLAEILPEAGLPHHLITQHVQLSPCNETRLHEVFKHCVFWGLLVGVSFLEGSWERPTGSCTGPSQMAAVYTVQFSMQTSIFPLADASAFCWKSLFVCRRQHWRQSQPCSKDMRCSDLMSQKADLV